MKSHRSIPHFSAGAQRSSSGGRQRGFSLVELMVGLAIGLVLSLGLFALLANTSRSFRVQDDFARMQENGALAIRYLLEDIHSAGFYGSSASATSYDEAARDAIAIEVAGSGTDCGTVVTADGAAFNLNEPMTVDTARIPSDVTANFPCIRANDFMGVTPAGAPGNPVIALRGAVGPVPVATVTNPANASRIYVQASPNRESSALLFKGSGYVAGRRMWVASSTVNSEAPIFEYQAHVYYIRPCSRPTLPATECSPAGTDDGGRSIPTLVRHELVGTTMQLVPLVEGIERLVLQFGLDDSPIGAPDGIPDRFVPNLPDPPTVTAVRIAVLVRTTAITPGYDDTGKTYDLGGGVVCSASVAATPGCVLDGPNFKRHVFTQTVQLRNCAARRGLSSTTTEPC